MLYWFCYILFALTFVTQLSFCLASWRKRHTTTGFYLFFWMCCGAVWAVGTLVCMPVAVPVWIKDLLDPVRMAVVTWVPVVMTFFALEYADRRRLIGRPLLLVLCVIPLISTLFLFTPLQHYFVSSPRLPLSEDFVSIKFAHGPWFIVHTLYSMALVLASGAIFFLQIIKSQNFLRRQAVLIFTGYLFPVAGMMLSAFPPASFPRIDYSSLAFPLTAVCWYIALFHYKLLDVAPIAHARIMEVMQDAVIVLTPQLTIAEVNASALEFLHGETHGDVLARHVLECWMDAPDALQALLTQDECRGEIEVSTPHRKLVLDVRYSIIKSAHRRDPIGGVLVMRDITDHVLLIEELDAYAHTVAHDLKNPLSAQRGYLEMVIEDASDTLDASSLEDLRRVSQITDDMIEIVHELLLLASMRREEHSIVPRALDMHAVLARLKTRLAAMCAHATIVEPERWPPVLGHAPWIEEVWANFISNAIKYGGSPPHIELGWTALPDLERVQFWIKDNGEGIDATQQQALFKAFSRLDAHRSIRGHGVGLSIVKRIVEHLHGDVGVESTPGEGARFWFTLPSTLEDA